MRQILLLRRVKNRFADFLTPKCTVQSGIELNKLVSAGGEDTDPLVYKWPLNVPSILMGMKMLSSRVFIFSCVVLSLGLHNLPSVHGSEVIPRKFKPVYICIHFCNPFFTSYRQMHLNPDSLVLSPRPPPPSRYAFKGYTLRKMRHCFPMSDLNKPLKVPPRLSSVVTYTLYFRTIRFVTRCVFGSIACKAEAP